MIEVDKQKCIGCGKCVNICPVSVIKIGEDKRAEIKDKDDRCIVCGGCIESCPEKAIKEV